MINTCNMNLYINNYNFIPSLLIRVPAENWTSWYIAHLSIVLAWNGFCTSDQGFALRFFQHTCHHAYLAVSYTLPFSGRARDLHPIDNAHARHTIKKCSCFQLHFYLLKVITPCSKYPKSILNYFLIFSPLCTKSWSSWIEWTFLASSTLVSLAIQEANAAFKVVA